MAEPAAAVAIAAHAKARGTNVGGPGAGCRRPPHTSAPRAEKAGLSLTRPREGVSGGEAAALAQLRRDPEAAKAVGLVRRFADRVRDCGVHANARCGAPITPLERCLGTAKRSGVTAVTTVAAGLQQDSTAVRAALTTSWSSGHRKGHAPAHQALALEPPRPVTGDAWPLLPPPSEAERHRPVPGDGRDHASGQLARDAWTGEDAAQGSAAA